MTNEFEDRAVTFEREDVTVESASVEITVAIANNSDEAVSVNVEAVPFDEGGEERTSDLRTVAGLDPGEEETVTVTPLSGTDEVTRVELSYTESVLRRKQKPTESGGGRSESERTSI